MVEHRSAPNAAPPLHLHRNEDEIFEILEGQFRFWLDGEIVEASPGTIIVAPRNGTHTWKNVGEIPGRMPVTFIPGGIDGLFVWHGGFPSYTSGRTHITRARRDRVLRA